MKKYMLEVEDYKKLYSYEMEDKELEWVDKYSYIEVSMGCGCFETVTEWGNGEELVNEYEVSAIWDDPSDLADYSYEIIEDGKFYTNCDLASLLREDQRIPFDWALEALDEIRKPWMESLPLDERELESWIQGVIDAYAYRGE